MMRKSSLVLCALLLLANADAFAQKKKKFCVAAPPSPFKHSGQIVTSFDSAARGMRTTLQHPRPLGGSQEALYMTASFVHQDPRHGVRPTVELALVSALKTQKYRDSHDVVLVGDGRPVPLSAAARYQSRAGKQGIIFEVFRLTLSADDLAGVTGARRVTARVGGEEFELTQNHLEALREMVSLLGGTAKSWRTE